MTHECIQETAIALLIKDKDNMAKDITEMKVDVSEIKKDMTLIKEHILTAPQKYPSRQEFDAHKKENTDFRDKINLKIASIGGGSAVLIFVLNKLL